MKYTIGEFAELLGVTADTLRLYEKYDIIKPMKNEINNYRYFDDFDARNMLMSRWYRSFNFPMHEVADLIQTGTFDSISEKINIRKEELEDEIRQKTLLLQKINLTSANLEKVEENLYQCSVKTLPGIYRIRQTDKNNLVKDDKLKEKAEEWMKYMPHTFFSFRINNRKVLSEDSSFDYNWGLALYEEEFHELALKADDMVEYIEPKKYISSVIISSEDYITRDKLEFMFDYVQLKKFCINGDIFGKIILTEKSKEIRQSYLEVNIPIA